MLPTVAQPTKLDIKPNSNYFKEKNTEQSKCSYRRHKNTIQKSSGYTTDRAEITDVPRFDKQENAICLAGNNTNKDTC